MNSKQLKLIITVFSVLLISIISIGFYLYISNQNQLIIGTKNMTEQRIIGYMIEDVVEANTDYEVEVKVGLGETSFLHGAIMNGDIDMYVDYSSNGFQGVLHQTYNGQSSEEINQYIDTEYNGQYDLDWISMIGFENTNAIICKDFCIDNNIKNLNQLKDYNDFTFAAPVSFYERSDGYNLLVDNYQFDIPNKNQYKMDPFLIYSAISSNEVDIGLGFTTDGRLQTDDYIVLEDNLSVFPKYDAGIIVSNQTKVDYPQLENQLLKFNNLITNDEMQHLNYLVEIEHVDEKEVAYDFVQSKDLI